MRPPEIDVAAAGISQQDPLAIVCGGGGFPIAVAEEVQSNGRPVFLIGLIGIAEQGIARFPHAWIKLGQFGHMVDRARGAGCRDILFVGAARRPAGWRDLAIDFGLVKRLPRIAALFRGGDDHLLSGLAKVIEEAGLRVCGVHEVAPQIMMPPGRIGRIEPSRQQIAEAQFGFEVLGALGPYDVGQGLVVVDRRVIAVEAAEGTDAMLARVAELRASGRLKLPARRGVFVKAEKPGQDLRVDAPALGPETIRNAIAADLAGIAVRAGTVMTIEREQAVALADDAGLFISGIAEVSR
jgi:UDP-2,3-diacylglucosamine hydrolase